MSASARFRSIVLCLAALMLISAAASAENTIRDKNDILVGNVEGWFFVRMPLIIYLDGTRRVPLLVHGRRFDSPDMATFTSGDCSGPAWISDDYGDTGINSMQSIMYAMKNPRRLYSTRPANPVVTRTIKSTYQFGVCAPNTPADQQVIKADRLVVDLFASYKPPFRVD